MDKEVPELMGVSKAIIENVVFWLRTQRARAARATRHATRDAARRDARRPRPRSHQEESNWPLADSSIVKKKFDDIFAATKCATRRDAPRRAAPLDAEHSAAPGATHLEHADFVQLVVVACARARDAHRCGLQRMHTHTERKQNNARAASATS